jgi:signal transduction histidine kinase
MKDIYSNPGSPDSLEKEKILAQMPGQFLILRGNPPEFTLSVISDELAQRIGINPNKLAGKPFHEFFPFIDQQTIILLKGFFEKVIKTKQTEELHLDGNFLRNTKERSIQDQLKLISKPVLNHDNEVQYIILNFSDYIKLPNQQDKENLDYLQKSYFLFMEAPVAICIVKGPEYIVELANEDMLEFLGRTPAIIGKTILEVLPEAREQGLMNILDQVRTSGKPYYISTFPATLLINEVRELRYFDLMFKPYFQDEKTETPGSIFCVAHNVTEQVDSRNKIRESEFRYRALIEESSVATALYTGPELRIQYANEIMIRYWGKDTSIIGKTFREALPELENQPFPAQLEEVYATGKIYRGIKQKAELIVQGKLQTFYFDYTYKPLRNKEGEIYGIHHMAIDVTKEVLSINKLQEEKERTKLAIDVGEMGLFEIDLGTKEITADDRSNALLGIEGALTLDKYLAVIHPDDVPDRRVIHDKNLPNNLFEYEFRVLLNDNKVRWVRSRGMTYQNESMEASKIFGVVQDITSQKEYEEKLNREVSQRTLELENKNRELLRSNENLEEFAHAASHDLKEPIRKIRFFTERLKDQLTDRLTEEEKQTFKRIDNASERMGALIDDLLLYSHISQRPMEMEEVDLNQKMNKVLEDLELDIQEKKAVVSIGTLPKVKGYRRQLQQLFQNLIGNALKYSKPGVVPHISVHASVVTADASSNGQTAPDIKYHLIEVSDNGIGFDPAESERIFQMFQRLHGNAEYRGTGVGLSIVKKVIENHNGKIEAEGRPGKGASFKVYLPV